MNLLRSVRSRSFKCKRIMMWRDKHDIEHRLIPVGEKELNGKVENTHKQDDREFFAWVNPSALEELRAMSRAYERRWNHERATKTLNWLTPVQTLDLANVRALAFLKFLKEKYHRKPKRKSQVSRYLTWLRAVPINCHRSPLQPLLPALC